MKSEKEPATRAAKRAARAERRVAKAEAKVAKAEARMSKAEAKLEKKKAKLEAAKQAHATAFSDPAESGVAAKESTSEPVASASAGEPT
jgi:multidrug resistance efflux pump